MDDYSPPTLAQAFEARGQTPPWTCSTPPNETSRRKPSAKTRDLIARLGLRYRPANAADLEAHAAMLALLCEDLADMPVDLLAGAISSHVATSPYMPKAADLIKLAQAMMAPTTSLEAYAKQLNEMSFSKGMGWHWYVRERNGQRELDRAEVQQ